MKKLIHYKLFKMPYCTIIGRKYGDDTPIFKLECSLYDMSCFVDVLRNLADNERNFDYFVVEPAYIVEPTIF